MLNNLLPPHKCGLYLEHNTYKDIYQSIEDALAEISDDAWVSPEDKTAAEATGEIWTLQWYPNTPIGFYFRAAATLENLLNVE